MVNIYSSLGFILAFSILNLVALARAASGPGCAVEQMNPSKKDKMKRILGYCCVLFLLLFIVLSRSELKNQLDFPLEYFAFLMSLSLGTIIFRLLSSEVSEQLSNIGKIFVILCYALIEDNICIEIIFSKTQAYFTKSVFLQGLVELFALLVFEVVLHYGLYSLIFQIWNEPSDLKHGHHEGHESRAQDNFGYQEQIVFYEGQDEVNQQKSLEDSILKRFIKWGFLLFLISITIALSLFMGVIEEIGYLQQKNNGMFRHRHFSDFWDGSYSDYSAYYWGIEKAFAGALLSILFPRFLALFDSANHESNIFGGNKGCWNKAFQERNKVFAMPLIAVVLLFGRFFVEFS